MVFPRRRRLSHISGARVGVGFLIKGKRQWLSATRSARNAALRGARSDSRTTCSGRPFPTLAITNPPPWIFHLATENLLISSIEATKASLTSCQAFKFIVEKEAAMDGLHRPIPAHRIMPTMVETLEQLEARRGRPCSYRPLFTRIHFARAMLSLRNLRCTLTLTGECLQFQHIQESIKNIEDIFFARSHIEY